MKVFYEKISDTVMLTVYNQDKVLDWQLNISVAKGYGYKFVQPIKTMIYVIVLGRQATFLFYTVEVSKES